MTVDVGAKGDVALIGDCGSEDAEVLLRQLIARPYAAVDWRGCDTAHTAVVQVLLAAGVRPVGPPRGEFLTTMVEPLLRQR